MGIPEHSSATYQEEDPAQYEEDYEASGYEGGLQNTGTHNKGEARTVLVQYIKKSEDNKHECVICGQSNSLRSNILNHVESVHFPNSFLYECIYCGKQFSSKNARNVHVSRNHKEK